MIRRAETHDAIAILGIWNGLIRDTTVTFTSAEKTLTDVTQRIETGKMFVSVNDHVQGYAAYGPFRDGPSYGHIAEHSITIAPTARGQGAGRALMDAIEDDAKACSIKSFIAGISAENVAGIAFHTKLGFAQVGHIPQAGHKWDRFIDLILMQKLL